MTDRTNTDRQRAFRQRQRDAKAAALVTGAPAAPQIATIPGIARWTTLHEQARRAIETMRDEMEAYKSDRSEQWQDSEKGAAFEDMIDRAAELLAAVEEFIPRPQL
jgi:hypothetical protein